MCVSQGWMEMGDKRWRCRGIIGGDLIKARVQDNEEKKRPPNDITAN